MIRVYVPSRGRADNRLLDGPAFQIPPSVEVIYVVGIDEVGRYAAALATRGLPARVIGTVLQPDISKVRQFIGEHAKKDGHPKFVMMDDDIQVLVRKADDNWQLIAADYDSVYRMLMWMDKALDTHENVGISGREGNNRPGVGSPETLHIPNTRAMRVQGFQTNAFLKCEHGRVRVMEDFDITLQILESGGSNLVSYFWAQGQRMTQETGGCSEWRTHEVHEEAARTLAKLHPGIVSLRQKTNKTDADGFGTRTEVTVQWKRAYAKGRASTTV